MRLGAVLVLLVALAGATVCVRLGFWQISRLAEKRALNAAHRAVAAAPPVRIGAAFPPAASVAGRAVTIAGHYDEKRQIVLSARFHQGEIGVEVVTPLVLEGGEGVLVNRGWLPAADGSTARPQDYPEPGRVEVMGYAEPIPRGGPGYGVRTITSDSLTLLSTRGLDLDSLGSRLPYALAPYEVRQSPGPGVPAQPARARPRELDESMHVGYAIQWFAFAAILLGGGAALVRSRRGARRDKRPSAG